uniref:transposase n=1 Tax=Algoriphagus formosus TaxID=2007308 RepID=UPI000C284A56|nr:transposase [Algoriphagus formosus]
MKDDKEKFDFKAFAKQAGDALRSGKPLAGKDGVFTPLLKMIIESDLEGELDDHLYETQKMNRNRRNGYGAKNLQSSLGGFEVLAPRDRNSSFEPQIVGKRQHKISSDIDQQIIALFGGGDELP